MESIIYVGMDVHKDSYSVQGKRMYKFFVLNL